MREHRPRVKQHFSQQKSKTSKLIKKQNTPHQADRVGLFECHQQSFNQFTRNDSTKFTKIRKQTMHMVKLEKEKIKENVRALVQYQEQKNNEKKESKDKYNKHEFIFLEVVLTQVPASAQIRPIQIPLPSPIYGPAYHSRHCLLVHTPQQVDTVNKRIEQDIIANKPADKLFHRYLSLDELNTKYKQLNEKKKLCQYYDLFFCDHKVYGRLTKLIGGVFYEKRKFPFPVDMESIPDKQKDKYSSHEEYLKDCLQHSYFQVGQGPVYTLKVARISQGVPAICKNVFHGVYNSIPHLLSDNRKHTQVKSISIKTSDSVSMPIY